MLVDVDLVTWLLSGVVRLGVVDLDGVLLDRVALGWFVCFVFGDVIVGIERAEEIELVLIILFGCDFVGDDLDDVDWFGRLLRTLFRLGFLPLDEPMMLIWCTCIVPLQLVLSHYNSYRPATTPIFPLQLVSFHYNLCRRTTRVQLQSSCYNSYRSTITCVVALQLQSSHYNLYHPTTTCRSKAQMIWSENPTREDSDRCE